MIITAKESKLDKVNRDFFRVVAVSSSDNIGEGVFNMNMLLPPASLLLARKKDEIGKKKFEKKYRKYLSESDSEAEYTLLTIGMALKAKENICFICEDDEMKYGYLDILAEFISEIFGVESFSLKEGNEKIKDAIDSLDFEKSEKKLLKSDEGLSEKKTDKRNKLIKRIKKELHTSLSYDGETLLNSLDAKYAIELVVGKLVNMGVFKIKNNNEIKDLDVSKLDSKSPLIQAILTAADSSKSVKKIINKVANSHDIKLKKKSLKEFDKTQLINLLCEMYVSLTIYRSAEHDD